MHDVLHTYWGYNRFRPLQQEIIESVLAGRDTLGVMPTGGGKSITFQVPALIQEGICIVVTPLVALMKDQVDNLRARGIKATYVHASLTPRELSTALDNCIFGKYKFLYLSPERLNTQLFRDKLFAMQVNLLVVDEAHCISQWGYDFRPSYLNIAHIRALLPDVPLLALTASATPSVINDIQTKLLFKESNVFKKSFYRPNLSYIVRKSDDKPGQLIHILNRVPGSAIVYVRSRKRTKEIADELVRAGVSADYFHAGLLAEEKALKQQAWKEDRCRVMVATNAFGMGIDKPQVRVVVHMDIPTSPEEYYQEAGRAGRDGEKAYAVALYAQGDKSKLLRHLAESFPTREYILAIYENLCNHLQIAMGTGEACSYDFNIGLFCHYFKRGITPTYNAIKILEQAGYLNYEEEADHLSRVMMTVKRDELYRVKGITPLQEQVLQTLLRSYTGLFADYVHLEERLLSLRSEQSEQEVYEALIALNRLRILHYIPRRKTPYITLLRPRTEQKHIVISREIYEERQERLQHRINSVIEYVTRDEECRAQLLLRYFGEEMKDQCGACDSCIDRREGIGITRFDEIEQHITALLREKACSITHLTTTLSYPQWAVIETIRFMCDNDVVQRHDGELRLTST